MGVGILTPSWGSKLVTSFHGNQRNSKALALPLGKSHTSQVPCAFVEMFLSLLRAVSQCGALNLNPESEKLDRCHLVLTAMQIGSLSERPRTPLASCRSETNQDNVGGHRVGEKLGAPSVMKVSATGMP